ncbi:hypothetical protein ACWPKO_25295 (plasmid) [Coraliomargarita sp. W4R53]
MSTPQVGTHQSVLNKGMRSALIAVTSVILVILATSAWLVFGAPLQSSSVSAVATVAPLAETNQSHTPTPGPIPNATPVDATEVQPLAATPTHANRLPPLPDPAPLIAAPLPDDAHERGKLARGYPTDVAGPAPDSDVIDTSITSEDNLVQVSLTARTDASPDEVREHFTQRWSGLRLAPSTADDGALSYTDQYSSLTLAFATNSGTGAVYTVFAVLQTG